MERIISRGEKVHGTKAEGSWVQVPGSPFLGLSGRIPFNPQPRTVQTQVKMPGRGAQQRVSTPDIYIYILLESGGMPLVPASSRHVLKFQAPRPRRKTRVQHKPYCLHELFGYIESVSSVDGGNLPESRFPDVCQSPTLQARMSKGGSSGLLCQLFAHGLLDIC